MPHKRTAAELTERVLHHLERQTSLAELNGDRLALRDYQGAQRLMLELLYGPPCGRRMKLAAAPPAIYINPNRDKPWFKAKYARPRRRVVANLEHPAVRSGGGMLLPWYEQRLSCGHVMYGGANVPGDVRRKYRDCDACGKLDALPAAREQA